MLSYRKWQNLSRRGRLLKTLRVLQGCLNQSTSAPLSAAALDGLGPDLRELFTELYTYLAYVRQDELDYDSSDEESLRASTLALIDRVLPALQNELKTESRTGPDAEPRGIPLLSDLRLRISEELGIGLADWDFSRDAPVWSQGQDSRVPLLVANRIVYLDGLRSPFNLGSVLRTAAFFGVDAVVVSEQSLAIDHPRAHRSAMGAHHMLTVLRMPLAELRAKRDLPMFAVEFGGVAVRSFAFPHKGILVLGNEEYGISPDVLEECRHSVGILTIPGAGAKASLNVGVAFGIACAAWCASG